MVPRNGNIEKIVTMRKLAMRRLAKRHKAGVLSHTGVRPSAAPFKKASMFDRVQATSATGKKYLQNFQNFQNFSLKESTNGFIPLLNRVN